MFKDGDERELWSNEPLNPALLRTTISPIPPTALPKLHSNNPSTLLLIPRKRCSSAPPAPPTPLPASTSNPTNSSPKPRKNRW